MTPAPGGNDSEICRHTLAATSVWPRLAHGSQRINRAATLSIATAILAAVRDVAEFSKGI
jgi:hypothetical protein